MQCAICGGSSSDAALGPTFYSGDLAWPKGYDGKWYHITCWAKDPVTGEPIESGLSSHRGHKPPPFTGPPVHRVSRAGSRIPPSMGGHAGPQVRNLPGCNSGTGGNLRGRKRISL